MAWAPNYPGKSDLSAYLRTYGGEVVAAYNLHTTVKDKLRVRRLSSGRAAQFPTISTEKAKVHTPGDDIFTTGSGDTYKSSMTNDEKTIAVNKMLIATAFVDSMDEAMQHYDSRSEYAAQMGAALGTAMDQWCIAALADGSDTSLSHATAVASLTHAHKKAELERAANTMDLAGIPREGRYLIVNPADYYAFATDNDVVSSDYGTGANRAMPGKISYLGIEIVNSPIYNQFAANADLNDATSDPLYYTAPQSGTRPNHDSLVMDKDWGLCFHKDAAGIVELRGLVTETDWIPERQGHLLVSKQMVGVDILRPSSAIRMKGA
tara:strand:- start:429 stop:1391 length:963 start_codon:yes stop_codon:yes gene_type:complete